MQGQQFYPGYGRSLSWFCHDELDGKVMLIGGIYARPLAMGNFLHFAAGAMALIKFAMAGASNASLWVAAASYAVFAIMFGKVIFYEPCKDG